jgi:hypothetical protein
MGEVRAMSGKPVDADESPDLLAEVRVLRQQVSQLQEEQQRQQRVQEQVQEQLRLSSPRAGETPGEGAGASNAAAEPVYEPGLLVDPLGVTRDYWDRMDLQGRMRLLAHASQQVFAELAALAQNHRARTSDFLVVAGREADGSPRVVYSGASVPDLAIIRRAEADTGCKAWQLTRVAPREAEESRPSPEPAADAESTGGSGLPWAAGVGMWEEDALGTTSWAEDAEDRYPQVRVRIRWVEGTAAEERAAEFVADLDTGASHCVFPLEELSRTLGSEVESVCCFLQTPDQFRHLGRGWLGFPMRTDPFRFEVMGRNGWVPFEPLSIREFVTTLGWDEGHALSQRRR